MFLGLNKSGFQTHQDVEAGGFEQSDLVGDGQAREARHTLGELHHLDDALGGELAELVPQPQVQLDPVVRTGVLRGRQDGDHVFTVFLLSNIFLSTKGFLVPGDIRTDKFSIFCINKAAKLNMSANEQIF